MDVGKVVFMSKSVRIMPSEPIFDPRGSILSHFSYFLVMEFWADNAPPTLKTFFYIQRAELLKQECHTGKVAGDIHRQGPKNTQKVANEL